MRRLVDDAGLGDRITVDSAGTSSEHLGEPPDRRTIKEARRRGLDVECSPCLAVRRQTTSIASTSCSSSTA